HPDADASLDDAATRAAYLQRLWDFAQRLPSSFNTLKAHVLHWWLRHDLTQVAPDKQRFLAYIRLPRIDSFAAERHRQRSQDPDARVRPATSPTLLGPIDGDEALIRTCLEQFFAREDSAAAYAEWLDAKWLDGVLAETKLLLGQGDPEHWYSLLAEPARVKQ